MKLICRSCNHDFNVDELNLDTDRVDCPECSWPNLVMKSKSESGYFGRFIRNSPGGAFQKKSKRWPSTR